MQCLAVQRSETSTRQSESSSHPCHERAELPEPLDPEPSEFALLLRPTVLRSPLALRGLVTDGRAGVAGVAGEETTLTELPRESSELTLESAALPANAGGGVFLLPAFFKNGGVVSSRTNQFLLLVLGVPPTDFESKLIVAPGEVMGVLVAEELESLFTCQPPALLGAVDLHARLLGAGEGERNRLSSNASSALRTLFQKCAWTLRASSIASRYIGPAAAGGDDGAELAPSVLGRFSSFEGSSSACTHAAMLCAVARKLYPPSSAMTTFPLAISLQAFVIR